MKLTSQEMGKKEKGDAL